MTSPLLINNLTLYIVKAYKVVLVYRFPVVQSLLGGPGMVRDL